jgi:uncharacterized Tic20 family protein
MNVADELQKLNHLYESGALTNEEFRLAKARILGSPSEVQSGRASLSERNWLSPEEEERQTRQWALFLHLSLLANYLVPLAGLVLPIVIWQLKKDELPGIDAHGKNALNWIISKVIYLVVSGILIFLVIGIPLLIALGIVGIIFPIIAALKANNGEVWKYPLAIEFLK